MAISSAVADRPRAARCKSPRVSKGDTLNIEHVGDRSYSTLSISPLLTRGLLHFVVGPAGYNVVLTTSLCRCAQC